MEEMNSQVKQDLKTLLLYLARGNVDRSNLYDELQQAWLKIKDSLP